MDEQEQQNINQVEPTPLSPSLSHKKLIIGVVAVFVLVVAGIVGAYFLLQPKAIPETGEQIDIIDTEEVKIGINSGIDKFYYAVIEKGGLVYPVGSGSYNFALPDIVTIFKYDINEARVSKAFGPYPSNANYLESNLTPRLTLSEGGDQAVFADSVLYTFRGGIKEFNIITPHKDLVTENTESPVISPDGEKIAYTVGDQIKMFDKMTGKYTVLIEDTTQLARGSQNIFGSFVYPVFWYQNGGLDRLLIEVRSRNQNSLPVALTKFYVYDFAQDAYSPTNFYYEQDKKIQSCSRYGWQCEESPIVYSRAPNGRYELIQIGDIGKTSLSVIDYSVLTNTHFETEGATKPLPACELTDALVWSYDSTRLLCSGLILDNDEPTYRYDIIDIELGTITTIFEKKIVVNDSEDIYTENVVGWIGKDTFLIIKTKLDKTYTDPVSQEVILTDLKGNEQIIGNYAIDQTNRLEGQGLIEMLESVNVNKESLENIRKDVTAGLEFWARIDEIYIKYLGSVAP